MNKKRIFDIILGISIFIFILPFILIFSIVIYLTDKGNPIYVSERVGLKGKKFKIYKIRTMVINADKIGGTSTSESDKRILPIGKLIRRLKLDEFTQVINVINGTMSFVGPRPNTILDVSYYSNEEKSLLDIKPGTILTFAKDKNITCEVIDDKLVKYKEREMSLSASALEIVTEMGYTWGKISGPDYWHLDGKSLYQMRIERDV